jgi:multicomponent K+:H+ antiporter subunit A
MLGVDGFAWMFGVIITVIGALVCLHARYSMSPNDPVEIAGENGTPPFQ